MTRGAKNKAAKNHTINRVLESEAAIPDPFDPLIDGHREPVRSTESFLFLAVVAQAWADAFTTPDSWLCGGRGTSAETRAQNAQIARGECRRWLVLNFGDWCGDRKIICSLAGIDPDALRTAARKRLALIKASEKPSAEIFNLDLMFSKLLAKEATMDPTEIDKAIAALAALEIAA